jgi:uncharacterized protein
MSEILGRFAWYELLTTDTASAEAFYTDVVGYTTQQWGEGAKPYTMWMADETAIGGLKTLPDEAKAMGAPPHWLAYVATPDIKDTVEKAEGLGAKVLMPVMAIPDVGHVAIFADPQGAVLGLLQPESDMPRCASPKEPGVISWNELMAGDPNAGWEFYKELFGWEKTSEMDMGQPYGKYLMYGQGEKTYGGFMNIPEGCKGPASWVYYATVKDIEASVERAREKGGKVLNGPMDIPGGGKVAQIMDIEGAAFALYQD